MKQFEYARAATIAEATEQLTNGQAAAGALARTQQSSSVAIQLPVGSQNGSRYLAGGTDLLTLMKADIIAPSLLVDIKRVDDLPRGIEVQAGGGVTLGALTTLSEIERHPAMIERYSAIAQAVSEAATPQLRNMATIGGNLLQRPRCWYYRNSLFHCWLKGGDECHARDGENGHHAMLGDAPCVAVHPSDAAAALVAVGATVRLRGSAGERSIPVSELFAEPTDDRRTETTLQAGELLLDIALPALSAGTRSVYLKAMDRKVWAFALVGVAAVVQVEDQRIRSASIVMSGVAPIPWRASEAEAMLVGQPVATALFAQAAEAAVRGAHPLEHNGYKLALARTLVSRALAEAAAQN